MSKIMQRLNQKVVGKLIKRQPLNLMPLAFVLGPRHNKKEKTIYMPLYPLLLKVLISRRTHTFQPEAGRWKLAILSTLGDAP